MKSLCLLCGAAVLAGTVISAVDTRARAAAKTQAVSACATSAPRASGPIGGLVTASDGFGFRLYDDLAGGAGNVFISPVGVELALAMAYDGAHGSTQLQMARVLGLQSLKQAAVRRQAARLLSGLQSGDPKARLDVANSLWARAGVPFQRRFIQDVRRDYVAKVAHLNFDSTNAPSIINSWVHCATHGAIPSVLRRIPANVILYLINAVTFQGQWSHPFDVNHTHVRAFITAGGRQEQASLMDQTESVPYYAGPDFQVAALPYGQGRFSMVLVLPKSGLSLATFRSRLTSSNWGSWMSRLRSTQGEIALPRFSLSNTFQLNDPLIALGLGQAFSSAADFSGMCKQRCRLSDVRHKTYLAVDEKGTIASSVTSVGVSPVAVLKADFHLVADHPFFLAIRDGKTASILFFGGVNDPRS